MGHSSLEYRVVFFPHFMEYFPHFCGEPVSTQEEAFNSLSVIADYTLYLHEHSLMPDYSNYGYIEQRGRDGEWILVEDSEE